MIGIGIIGGGRISGAHAAAAQALPETRLAGIAEVDAERRAAVAERYGCPTFAGAAELLADPGVDAAVIALPHWLHCEAALAALAMGKHVLLEKPMAMTVEECDRIIAAGQAAGRVVMVGHHHHYVPVNLEAQRLMRAGEIGNLVLASDTWYKPFYSDPRPPWFLDAAKGGGMWPMNGAHMIDRLTFFLGSDVLAVKACVGNPIYGHPATDMGIAFLQFAGGVCATIMHAGYRDGVMRFEGEITGTEGQIRVGGRQLWRSRNGEWAELPVPAPEIPCRPGATAPSAPFGLEMTDFARAIWDGIPPGVTGEYGRQIVRVLTACEQASKTGREVRLDEASATVPDSSFTPRAASND
jgi:predicted dehydrogenase